MVTALILSGGTGTRLGSNIPKQYIEVNGRTILSYCVETLSKSNRIDGIRIVAADAWRESILNWLGSYDIGEKFQGFSEPGENRQLSVFHGICDIRKDRKTSDASFGEELVLIHDGARPLLTGADVETYVDAAAGHDGVLPVLPMKDTVYFSHDGKAVSSLLDRSRIFAGQAPEVFRLDKYIEANERLIRYEEGAVAVDSPIYKINGSAEPAVMAGMDIAMVPGDEGNFKITTAEDLERFRQFFAAGKNCGEGKW
ncbi:MAG: IspD/TarI family cytidylyltransferase [Acetatifactor sp.]